MYRTYIRAKLNIENTSNSNSSRSTVSSISSQLARCERPALLTITSTWPKRLRTLSKHDWCVSMANISIFNIKMSFSVNVGALAKHSRLTFSNSVCRRAERHSLTSFLAKMMANCLPMPLDAPVIQTVLPLSDAALCQVFIYRGWNMALNYTFVCLLLTYWFAKSLFDKEFNVRIQHKPQEYR